MSVSLPPSLPGLLPLFAIALLASLLTAILGTSLPWLPLSPILLGILAGMALAPVAQQRPTWSSGIALAAGPLLKLAVVLIGLRLSLAELATTGMAALPVVLGAIIVGLGVSALLGRILGVSGRLTALLGVGTAICGASAIGATAPALRARADEIAYAIACVAMFGLAATLVYPPLFQWLLGDSLRVGLALGGAIHDTAQVMGAAAFHENIFQTEGTVEAATVSKLLRNLSMVAVIPLVVMLASKPGDGPGRLPKPPLFIGLFLLMVMVRSAGDLWLEGAWLENWQALLSLAAHLSAFLFIMAMAALGLGVRVSVLRSQGGRPALVAIGAAILVGMTVLLLSYLLV
ncbi:putative sulfate exporter family transporter [Gammaproteobacteria bacterium AB-CW1]|uniref:Sulfate exporter family transporter n=1 Tax=Natronospira elongata TaxID=3110268 RepID=A0AAP6JDJ2_9GAMM|nr:putative sulfate exporter family transporter [Gammaproteobacteria bacterium AB-CW1]